MAAISESVARATEMRVVEVEDFGPHYAETLRRWRARFLSRLDAVQALGLDARFCRLWDFYLAYCEAGMREATARWSRSCLPARRRRRIGGR